MEYFYTTSDTQVLKNFQVQMKDFFSIFYSHLSIRPNFIKDGLVTAFWLWCFAADVQWVILVDSLVHYQSQHHYHHHHHHHWWFDQLLHSPHHQLHLPLTHTEQFNAVLSQSQKNWSSLWLCCQIKEINHKMSQSQQQCSLLSKLRNVNFYQETESK